MKISVIIPVYNVEEYLSDCLDSVINQHYQDLEIILVDDGSKDASPMICDYYAQQDKRITVVHKKNGGLSSARNLGITMAHGEYVLFLDSDDLWNGKDAIEKLALRAELTKADIINFSFAKYVSGESKHKPYFSLNQSMPLGLRLDGQIDYLAQNGLYIASAWNKFIKREILEDNGHFEEGVFSEDIDWCLRILFNAKQVDFLHEILYLYRQRPNSIRRSITQKNCCDLMNGIKKCYGYIENADCIFQKLVRYYTAYQIATFFVVQAQTDSVPHECIDELSNYIWLLKYHGNSRKVFGVRVACSMLGYRRVCVVIRKLLRIR